MKKILTLILTSLTLAIHAQPNQYVGFAWSPSPDSNIVSGYKLYLNDTNSIADTNGLATKVAIDVFPLQTDSKVTAIAYDATGIESEPSNALFLYRPIPPYSLGRSNLSANGVTITWAEHPSINVNSYYVFVGTNKVKTVINNNLVYLDATNLVRSAQNSISLVAFNNDKTNTAGTYILESPKSTNINIVLPPRPPSLRINVIVQSSTNLISWNNVTNYEHLTESSVDFEVFRAKMEISKN